MNLSGVNDEQARGRSIITVSAIGQVAGPRFDKAKLKLLVPVARDGSRDRDAPMQLQFMEIGRLPDVDDAALNHLFRLSEMQLFNLTNLRDGAGCRHSSTQGRTLF